MSCRKVVVQGIEGAIGLDYNNECSTSDTEKSLGKKLECLKPLFYKFGPVDGTYLSRGDSYGTEDCVHVVFRNPKDALTAWQAGQRGEITLGGKALTLTLTPDDEAPIEILNDDCLLTIFSKLDIKDKLTAEKVCKRWETLAVRHWVNQKIIDFSKSECNLQEIEECLLRCGHHVDHVAFSTFHHELIHSHLSLIENHCKSAQTLTISVHCGFTDNNEFHEILSSMLRKIKNLKHLRLLEIYQTFSFSFLEDLCTDVETFWFSANSKYDQHTSLFLDLSRFQNLKALTLSYFTIAEGALSGLESLENLTSLSFKDSEVHASNVNNIQYLTKLRFLDISLCQIEEDVLLNIVANNRNLEVLDISSIQSVTDRSLRVISTLANLKRLRIRGLPNAKLLSMNEMPELEVLDCSWCPNVDREDLMKLVQTSPKLKRVDFWNKTSCNCRRVTNSATQTVKYADAATQTDKIADD